MDEDNSNSAIVSGNTSELSGLQKELEDKESRIQELKKRRDEVKKQLENKTEKISEENMENLKMLVVKYECLRNEYEYYKPPSATKSRGKKE